MKRILPYIIIFLIIGAIFVIFNFVPGEKFLAQVPFVQEFYNNTELTINTPNGKASITIDDEYKGQTPLSISALPEGQHEIKLERVSEAENFYTPHEFTIDLKRNTEAVINIEILPGGNYSGYILYFSDAPSLTSNDGYVSIRTEPTDTTIRIDATPVSGEILTQKFEAGEHKITVEKDGYESLEIPIVVRVGLNLNVQVNLFPLPIDLNNSLTNSGE